MKQPRAFYNEIDPDAAFVLRCLIAEGLIADGHVSETSIKDLQPDDLEGYTQVHLFAGAGLWSVAARLAGWPDERPLWSASCPCQPFSVIGKQAGELDPRDLWPDTLRLISARRPPVVVGEQVATTLGYAWFDRVRAGLDREDYASRPVDIPVGAVDGPIQRNRLYWSALGGPVRERLEGQRGHGDHAAGRAEQDRPASSPDGRNGSAWAGAEWIECHDGQMRRSEPGIWLMVDGLAGRVPLWSLVGNSISPILAAEVIASLMDVLDSGGVA